MPRFAPSSRIDEPSSDGGRSPLLPSRGRHPVARISLRRVAVPRAGIIESRARAERRREQMPLPPGFVDRRRAA